VVVDKTAGSATLRVRRRPLFAGALALVSTPTLLTLGEAFPRLAELPMHLADARTAQTGLFVPDEAAGYVMRPHFTGRLSGLDFDQQFQTNARGLRGPDLPPKVPGEFRIVVLGDSIVFGGQVPEQQRLTERLEALLHERGLIDVRVINAATPGWGTLNEAGFLASNSSWLEPDLVVAAVYIGNDIEENVLATAGGYEAIDKGAGIAWGKRGQSIIRESIQHVPHNFSVGAIDRPPTRSDPFEWHAGDPLPKPAPNSSGSVPAASDVSFVVAADTYVPSSTLDAARTWLGQNSRIYQALRDRWFALQRGYSQPRTLTLFQWQMWILRDLPSWYWIQLGYPLTEHYLDRARAAAASVGAAFVTLLVPRDAQVLDNKREEELGHLHLSADEVDFDRPNRELSQRAARLGIDVIDLLPLMRARADRSAFTFPHDYHLTAAGHTMVAEALANGLDDLGCLQTCGLRRDRFSRGVPAPLAS
jgi:lysophospholipase L1-like esterase